MPPTISVIVPAFNVERYVGEAIDSLLQQTKPFFEVIVVDDGSTDGTTRILERYERDGSITMLRTPNGGPGPARNLGLSRATGEYVYLFDSDDKLAPNFVERMQGLITESPGVDTVYFSGGVFFDTARETTFKPTYTRLLAGSFGSGIEATKALIAAQSFFTQSCLYLSKRSIWTANRLSFPAIIHEDEVVAFEIACLSGASVAITDELFFRRVRDGSIMTSPKTTRHSDGYKQAFALTAQFIKHRGLLATPLRNEARCRLDTLCMAYINTCRAIATSPSTSFVLKTYRKAGTTPGLRTVVHLLLPATVVRLLKGVKRRVV